MYGGSDLVIATIAISPPLSCADVVKKIMSYLKLDISLYMVLNITAILRILLRIFYTESYRNFNVKQNCSLVESVNAISI